ncbi:phosphoethanolamine transferase [Acidovorax sp. LjRoot118]|uniref:phosphoethanolamine transferase n=1 Tax=Acidovorax sp. LjRoot118 TaxID=3342256 RepID=UPI003ECC689F
MPSLSMENARRNFAWLLFYALCGVFVSASLTATLDGTPTQYIRYGEALFFSSSILVVFFSVLKKIWIGLLVALPLAILVPIELWSRINLGVPVSPQSMALVLETSAAETVNFFLAYGEKLIPVSSLWIGVYCAALLASYRQGLEWPQKTRLLALTALPLIIFISYANLGMPPWIAKKDSSNPFDGRVAQGWSQQWLDIFPVNIVVAFQQYGIEEKKMAGVQAAIASKKVNIKLSQHVEMPELVVIVVGESSSAGRWSLLGYERETNPRLSKESNMVVFGDVIALSTATRSAVPGVLSNRPALRPDGSVDLNPDPSFITAFKEAGYKTYWYSNQAPFGKFDSSIAVHARESAVVRFFNPATFDSSGSFDGVLISPLAEVLKENGKKLVVLHTMGSHFDYKQRYPKEFGIFDESRGGDVSEEMLLNDSYDNSVVYTDYFLAEVIRLVSKSASKAVVAYFSDHGVDLPGGKCKYRDASRFTESAYHVPLIVWFSAEMRNVRGDIWEKLLANKNAPFTTGALSSTLLEISGINVLGRNDSENLLEKQGGREKTRLVGVSGALINFDSAKKRNFCFISAG